MVIKVNPQLFSKDINIAGSSIFGRYPKISNEHTWNMFVVENWLIPYSGYSKVYSEELGRNGRGFNCFNRCGLAFAVFGSDLYSIDKHLLKTKIAELETYEGDVFIEANLGTQIGIVDQRNLYIFDYVTNAFQKVNLDFSPSHLSFQNGRFICTDLNRPVFRLSGINNGFTWSVRDTGLFQSKEDMPVATIPMPGVENLLMIVGNTVSELWSDVGARLFPYQRVSSHKIDSGTVNKQTIAASEDYIIWVAKSKTSGLKIMMTNGGQTNTLPSDGINFELSQLQHPEASCGFLIEQDGRPFYQIAFYHHLDNISYSYDIQNKKFYNISNENLDCHIAKKAMYFSGAYYFISHKNGYLYRLDNNITTYDGSQIPRLRIIAPIKDEKPFVINSVSLELEQGAFANNRYIMPEVIKGTISLASDFPTKLLVNIGDAYFINGANIIDNDLLKTNTLQYFKNKQYVVWNGFNYDVVNSETSRVDVSISKDGNTSFSGGRSMDMLPLGYRKNKFSLYGLGYCNEASLQFRFYGANRFLVSSGKAEGYR